jgi:predicted  nucleic acid-binding Zn-ribbon protein
VQNNKPKLRSSITKTLILLSLVTLLLMKAPLQIVSAQEPQPSVSVAPSNELLKLKTALSNALDRIEDDNDKIAAAEEYITKLELEKELSEKALAGAKEERDRLVRLRELDKEEASKLQSVIAALEKERASLQSTIAAQDKVIIKTNEKLHTAKKLGIYGTIGGILVGVLAGIKLGGIR